MNEVNRFVIPALDGVRSLAWEGNRLVDWAAGGAYYDLDGRSECGRGDWAGRFDAAVTSPDGRYAAVYEILGIQGLLLREGEKIREIQRDEYHSEAYEYPVALFTLPDGRPAVVHCPDDYRTLEIEEVETGRRLTGREGSVEDFFHSRLRVSPDGRRLLSAGWFWQPFDWWALYDIERALADPSSLDTFHEDKPFLEAWDGNSSVVSAAFVDADRVLLAGARRPTSHSVGLYSLRDQRFQALVPLSENAGTMMPLPAGDLAIAFFDHPKLLEVTSGKILARWPELSSGLQETSIIWGLDERPCLALDPANRRFAVAGPAAITVVQLG